MLQSAFVDNGTGEREKEYNEPVEGIYGSKGFYFQVEFLDIVKIS